MTPTKKNVIDATINTTTVSDDSRAGVTHVSLCLVLFPCFPVNDSVTNHMTVPNAIACWHHNIIASYMITSCPGDI